MCCLVVGVVVVVVVVVMCILNLLSNEVIAVSEHSTLVVVAYCSFGVPGRQDL